MFGYLMQSSAIISGLGESIASVTSDSLKIIAFVPLFLKWEAIFSKDPLQTSQKQKNINKS